MGYVEDLNMAEETDLRNKLLIALRAKAHVEFKTLGATVAANRRQKARAIRDALNFYPRSVTSMARLAVAEGLTKDSAFTDIRDFVNAVWGDLEIFTDETDARGKS